MVSLGVGEGCVRCSAPVDPFKTLQQKFLLTSAGVNLQARGIPKRGYAFRKHDKTCWMLWKKRAFLQMGIVLGRSGFPCQLSCCCSCFTLNCLCCFCDDSSVFLLGISLIAIMPSSFIFTASSTTNQHPVCLLYCSCIRGRRL